MSEVRGEEVRGEYTREKVRGKKVKSEAVRGEAAPGDEHGLRPLVHEEVLLRLGHAAHRLEEPLELLVALHDERVEAHEVLRLLAEALLAGGELQDLGDGAEVPALVVGQLALTPLHHVEALGRHDGRVDEAVVDEVAHHLEQLLLLHLGELLLQRPEQHLVGGGGSPRG